MIKVVGFSIDKYNKVHLALKAVQRVRIDSGLRNLWVESGNETDWFMAVDGLLDRLAGQ